MSSNTYPSRAERKFALDRARKKLDERKAKHEAKRLREKVERESLSAALEQEMGRGL